MLLDTPICNFGWNAPEFTLSDRNGTSFTMPKHLGDNGLLIMFIGNHCAYVQTIGNRLAADTKTLMAEGINVLAVMSNDYHDYSEDSPENMLKYATRYGWEFPYLVDEDRSVGKSYGAVCTPDFFGFNKDGGLQYRGRLNDGTMGQPNATTPEMLNAMRMIAKTGNGPQQQTASMGCSIKWSR